MKYLLLLTFCLSTQAKILITNNSLNDIENESFPFFVSSNHAGSNKQLYVEEQGSAGLYQQALPAEVFVPVMGSGTTVLNIGDTLFTTHLPDPITGTNDALGVQISHDEASDRFIYVAYEKVSGDDDWTVVPTSFSPNIPDVSGSIVSLSPNTNAIVYFDLSSIFREKGFDPLSPLSSKFNFQEEMKIVITTRDNNTEPVGGEIKPADIVAESGLFFEIKITDKIPGPEVSVAQLNPLDGQVQLEIAENSPTNLGDGIYKTAVHLDTAFIAGGAYQALAAPVKANTRLEPGKRSGNITIDGLENNIEYFITASYVSKYQIVGPYLASEGVTPDEILTFLREKSCFIVSAGFGEDHFIIEYFRDFRDQVLAEFSLGQKFIKWYYKYSPALAVKIYHNSFLSFLVRTSTYLLYLMMEYYYILIGAVLLSYGLYRRRRYLKIV